ncbi:oxygenase MpaB family protein [Novosphingobium sp. JCM 18896]|uniref:oxygenase MpaB family protein n=1 Tax=Novosphingobium sp. JCM 18896 TaxID=2989731 RepID=UPI0022239877|nr:oxygenase MpaB family protein [Novosphingobium sp. JCM 18896]MCW1430231.1 oxygenase MpaB family protein [Novosphingobium sp. JCM 18896]
MLRVLNELMRPPSGITADFTKPIGEPSLAPADGVSWRIFANPVTVFIGGVAAVLLELAEPSVRSGVWDNSSFRRDPLGRLRRTGFAAMTTVYGPRGEAERMIARVVAMHAGVRGTTADGLPYSANDPRLLNWVQATAIFGFTEAYSAYASKLTPAEKSAVFAEGQAAAKLYGAVGAPGSWPAWERLLTATAPTLEGSDILSEFRGVMSDAAILPAPLKGLQRLLVRAAVEIVPEPVRSLPQLEGAGLRAGERLQVRAIAAIAGFLRFSSLPAAQAARRMRAG